MAEGILGSLIATLAAPNPAGNPPLLAVRPSPGHPPIAAQTLLGALPAGRTLSRYNLAVPPPGTPVQVPRVLLRSPSRPVPSAPPILIEVTRGDLVESRHAGSAIVVDAAGKVVAAWGDPERPVFGRSAIKPLQALPLVESGAAEHFALGDAELCIACGSHGGEPEHTRLVEAWLSRLGLSPAALECGCQLPLHEPSAHALLRAGVAPGPQHNNCSGKHTGMLTHTVHRGEPTPGYIRPEHPSQQRVRAALEAMTGLNLATAPRGIDGCGLPQYGMPLRAMAHAMALFEQSGNGFAPAKYQKNER